METQTVYTLVDASKRLPAESGWYFCKINNYGSSLFFHSDLKYWRTVDGNLLNQSNITHLSQGDTVTHYLEKQTDVFIFTEKELEQRDRERDQRVAGEALTTAFGWGVEITSYDQLPKLKEQYLNNLK